MSRLAIVGTSKPLLEIEVNQVEDIIADQLVQRSEHGQDLPIIITGGANGVDSLAGRVTQHLGCTVKEILPKTKTTLDYLARNRMIAEQCDELWCFTTKRIITELCYHHKPKERHQKTAGCYTMNFARNLGKPTRLFVI